MSSSLFYVQDQDERFFNDVLSQADLIKSGKFSPSRELVNKKVGLLFFEPSSRTRWSFEKSCLDLGVKYMTSVVDGSTSLAKGEENRDTLELYIRLGFDLIVMRSKEEPSLKNLALNSSTPFVNAGFGQDAHPTQALLDYFTWTRELEGFTKTPKVLIMGDVKHSRVARSHLRLAKILNYKVGLLQAPGMSLSDKELDEFKPSEVFSNRADALLWADFVMSLRVQKERHQGELTVDFPSLKKSELRKEQYVLHPGPFIRGEDLDEDVISSKQSLIFKQKENGVYCRSALLSFMLSGL